MVTESPRETGDRAHIDITLDEFEHRLAAHGYDDAEIHRLWDELAALEPMVPSTRARSAQARRDGSSASAR